MLIDVTTRLGVSLFVSVKQPQLPVANIQYMSLEGIGANLLRVKIRPVMRMIRMIAAESLPRMF